MVLFSSLSGVFFPSPKYKNIEVIGKRDEKLVPET